MYIIVFDYFVTLRDTFYVTYLMHTQFSFSQVDLILSDTHFSNSYIVITICTVGV